MRLPERTTVVLGGSPLARIAWQAALIQEGLWPLIGLHQKLAGDPLAASPSFVTHLPVDPSLVGDSDGKELPPPSVLMMLSAGVSFWLCKPPPRHPEWLSFLVGGARKASRSHHCSNASAEASPIYTSGLTLHAHLLVDQGLHPLITMPLFHHPRLLPTQA